MKIEQLLKPNKMSGKKSMLATRRVLLAGVAASAMFILLGCVAQSTQTSSGMEPSATATSSTAIAGEPQENTIQPVEQETTALPAAAEEAESSLPVRFQKPSYTIKDIGLSDETAPGGEELTMMVGADITTTEGPVPLRDIMKQLAALHKMNISWASDVDQYVYVDVNMRADEDFFKALDNMLRQVDYFYEMDGNTIVIKFKETRKFHVALPPRIKGQANINTSGGTTTNTDSDNSRWDDIEKNLKAILNNWSDRYQPPPSAKPEPETNQEEGEAETAVAPKGSTLTKISSGFFSVDRALGLITVTAPRPLLDKVRIYVDNLKEEMYKQINIEAKILEVTLEKGDNKGIDWSSLLKGSAFNFTAAFGTGGQIYPNSGRFLDTLTLDAKAFDLVLDALESQGTTKVLSNPRLSVMNGQPAVIYVGDNVTYISKVDTTINEGTVTTSVTTAQAVSGLRLEVYATVMNDDEIVMSIIPMISELDQPIEYKQFGTNQVGLPEIRERTMNSMVRLNNGEMLIVGGLISSTDIQNKSNVPILGKIPGMKYIFGNKGDSLVRKELVVLLRPKIL